jgi:hypothetical protein
MELRGVNITNTNITVGGSPAPSLLLSLDAQDYSGSGTTWPANVGTNATLFNTPTYNAASPTYFNFDNTSQEYASTTNLPSQSVWTVETWFRVTSTLTVGPSGIITAVVTDEFEIGRAHV